MALNSQVLNVFHPSLQVAQWEQDSFIRTTFLVIRYLSLFDHSDILQFKVTETYDSRFFQTTNTHTPSPGEKIPFSPLSKTRAVYYVKLLLVTILLTTTNIMKYCHSCLEQVSLAILHFCLLALQFIVNTHIESPQCTEIHVLLSCAKSQIHQVFFN